MLKVKDQNGFTLIEALVAMVILSIGIFALYSMQIRSVDTNAKASTITTASNWASDQIELLLNRPYDCSPEEPGCHDLDDVNGDGTNQDLNEDGVDDDAGENFGLENKTPATADGTVVSPDGLYTIYWNIAINHPVPDVKTIHVIVTSPEIRNTPNIEMTYYKFKG